MKRFLTVTLALGVLMASTASLAADAHPDAAPTKKATAKAAGRAGLKGCLVGGLGALFGGGNAVKGCISGGAVAAIAAGVAEHKKQVAAAHDLARDAQDAGMNATVSTTPVTVRDDKGHEGTTDALDQLVLPLDAARVAKQDAGLASILAKAAVMADGSSTPVTLTVEGTRSQRTWIASTLRARLKPDTTATVVERAAKSPRLILAPVPAVRHD